MRIICILAAVVAAAAASTGCYPLKQAKWEAKDGKLFANGKLYVLKGINWFGAELDTMAPHGLWDNKPTSVDKLAQFLKDNKFNTVRLPFSVEMVLWKRNTQGKGVGCSHNGDYACKLKPLDFLEYFVDKMGWYGINVLLDSQRLRMKDEIPELWYGHGFTQNDFYNAWDIVMKKLGCKWNVMGIDLKNEPHGKADDGASWGYGNTKTDWNTFAVSLIKDIQKKNSCYRGLFFVEGVGWRDSSPTQQKIWPHWGENLAGAFWHPLKTGDAKLDARLVYAPHTYGPGTGSFDYFKKGDFPNNMFKVWDQFFGFVEHKTKNTVVIGEWGGYYDQQGGSNSADRIWQDKFKDYMWDRCLSDNFYWALNPDSGDTGGILKDDWKTPVGSKLRLLNNVNPNPSRIWRNKSQWCISEGQFSNPKCMNKQPVYVKYPQ